MNDYKPLECIRTNPADFRLADMGEPSTIEITRRLHAEVLDKTDDMVVDAVIKAAQEAGITDLYLLDKNFVLGSLISNAKRYTSCDYCRGVVHTDKPFTVITQTANTVRTVFNFCPVCGRALKGKEEEHE